MYLLETWMISSVQEKLTQSSFKKTMLNLLWKKDQIHNAYGQMSTVLKWNLSELLSLDAGNQFRDKINTTITKEKWLVQVRRKINMDLEINGAMLGLLGLLRLLG